MATYRVFSSPLSPGRGRCKVLVTGRVSATSYQQVPHSPALMTPLLARAQTTQITRISAAGIRREVETLRREHNPSQLPT